MKLTKRSLMFSTMAALLAVDIAWAGELEGTWTGTLTQRPYSYPIEISFAQSGATVAYPSLGCVGRLIPVRSDGKVFSFSEKIDRGICENNGRVEISRAGAASLSFKYYDRHNNLISGVLTTAKPTR